jgi:hypothetical protein
VGQKELELVELQGETKVLLAENILMFFSKLYV